MSESKKNVTLFWNVGSKFLVNFLLATLSHERTAIQHNPDVNDTTTFETFAFWSSDFNIWPPFLTNELSIIYEFNSYRPHRIAHDLIVILLVARMHHALQLNSDRHNQAATTRASVQPYIQW
jgi:hypothetical protein